MKLIKPFYRERYQDTGIPFYKNNYAHDKNLLTRHILFFFL